MQLDQAKVETLRLLYFRLGYCGSNEEVKALTLVAIVAAESLFNLFIVFSRLSCSRFYQVFFCFFCGNKNKKPLPDFRTGEVEQMLQFFLLKTSIVNGVINT